MMCLGWSTRSNCQAQQPETVVAPTSTCPNISWFWLGLAAIGVGLVTKKQ